MDIHDSANDLLDTHIPGEKDLRKTKRGIIRAASDFFRFARYSLTLSEQRIIYYAILMGEKAKQPFSPIAMPVKVFTELSGYSGGRLYSMVRAAANGLTQKNVEVAIKTAAGKLSYIAMPWISKVEYVDGDGVVKITPNPELREYFMGTPFSTEEYYYLFRFRSQYSARLYELLTAHAFKPISDFDVDDLRARLGVAKDKYTRYNGFKARVLAAAIEDINEFTDLSVELREKKGAKGRVQTVYFMVTPEKNQKKLADREDEGEISPRKRIGKSGGAPDVETLKERFMQDLEKAFPSPLPHDEE